MKALPSRGSARPQSGVALIITLAVLVLSTALVVALLLSLSSERTDSSAAIRQGEVQQLAAGVVDLVKSTITQATAGYESGASGSFTANRTAWASQPGLIRTWKENGTPYKSFRLYSGGNLAASDIVVDGTLNITDDAPPSGWKSTNASYNALWCDLNAPAASGTNPNSLSYPIVTPPKSLDSVNGIPTDDLTTSTQEGVQGFAITSPPGFTSGSPSATNNPAPMPVKWLYVLQDGTFVSPTGTGTVVTVAGASQANPIVGRVAYWTDDETCKVNVNTAGEYYHWTAPATKVRQDGIRARAQPGADEYQRFPGHPATTSLSAIFEGLAAPANESDSARAARYQKIFNLTPRISGTTDGKAYSGGNGGGSQAGTAISWLDPSKKITLDPDRMLASEDEILYDPARTQQFVSAGIIASPRDLAGRKFFLTGHNSSSDLNWMGRPRISLWPLNPDETAKWSHYDNLLAFCSTINGSKYYFQRTDGLDVSNDFNIPRNRQIYDYLKNELAQPIPGASGKAFSSKTSRNIQQLLTNIFDYIRGFINRRYSGGNIGTKDDSSKSYYFPPGLEAEKPGSFAPAPTVVTDGGITTKGIGSYPVIADILLHFWAVKPGETSPMSQTTDYPTPAQVTPTNITRTIQMNLVLNLVNMERTANTRSPQYQMRVSGDPWTISNGSQAGIDAAVSTNVGITSTNIGFPSPSGAVMRDYNYKSSARGINFEGGYIGLGSQYRGSTDLSVDAALKTRTFSKAPGAGNFTLYSDPINLSIPIGDASKGALVTRTNYSNENTNPAMMKVSGGTITVEVFPGLPKGSTNESDSYDITVKPPVQTYTINVPACELPVPLLGDTSSNYQGYITASANIEGPPGTRFYDFGSWATRAKYVDLPTFIRVKEANYPYGLNSVGTNPWFMDVVRAITLDPDAAHKGDFRVLANARNIPASWYKSEYTSNGRQTNPVISTLILNNRGDNSFRLFKDQYYWSLPTRTAPVLLNGVKRGGVLDVGDFVNGPGAFAMGGYFTEQDMGAVATNNQVPYYMEREREGTGYRSIYNTLVYSPSRMVPSPLVLGQLSTYLTEANPNPWETLLFCRNPQGGTASHNGWADPKDHYLLDLFNMPVVEPYAISQPLETQGQANLNQAIAPFSYINRTTSLHAVLKGIRLYAIADKLGGKDKPLNEGDTLAKMPDDPDFTLPLDVPKTVDLISQRGPFITASEFTEVFLVLEGQTASTVDNFWKAQYGTGDDLREAPYAHIYPKVTTKSNTYTVHMRVQALKQTGAGGNWGVWDESKDQVVSEYRGSATIERYVDPNDTSIPDFAQPANYTKNLAPYYRWRTVSEKQFIP